MFDSSKHYRTRCGDKVTIHEVVRFNAIGEEVTFPVKGSISRPGKRGSRYSIWTPRGNARVLNAHPDDIVGLWETQQ
jgi:hypothetical protein